MCIIEKGWNLVPKFNYDQTVKQNQSPISNLLLDCLSTDSRLEVNAEIRMVSLLNAHCPQILAQQQFSRNEWILLMTLLHSYPYYAPYETLLSELTALSHVSCCQRLQEAQFLGIEAVKRELKPVYRALSGVRVKLNRLCPELQISLIRGAGYVIAISSAMPQS